MKNNVTRRHALQSVATAGAGAILMQTAGFSQTGEIRFAGQPVEIALTVAGPETVRITAQPVVDGQPLPIPSDGALVKDDWGQPVVRLRSLSAARTVKVGDLTAKLSNAPLTIRIEAQGGRLVQELKCDPASADILF